jgi:hypothetical protein
MTYRSGPPIETHALLALLLFAAAPAPLLAQDRPEATVTTTRGIHKTRHYAVTDDRGLRIGAGEGRILPHDDLVSVEFPAPPPRQAAPAQAVLANGDVLYGSIESESDVALRLRTPFGPVALRFEHLRRLTILTTRGGRWTRAPDLARGDLIRLASGEEDVGVVERVGETQVGFRSAILKERLNYPLRDVAEIHFQPVGARSLFEPGRLFASVALSDGSSIRGNLRSLAPEGVKLDAEVASLGETVLPLGQVASIAFHNGSLVYLSDLAPTAAAEKPFVGTGPTFFPHQRDRAVTGDDRPISVDGKRYARGLGVHARSELAFALEGKFSTFQAVAGLDDSAAGGGSVVFKVIGDGKTLFDSGLVAGREWAKRLEGAAPGTKEIRVDVRGVRTLTLCVECGPDDDVLDRAAWADAKLIK